MTTWNPSDFEHRAWMREFLGDETSGLDLSNLAAVLKCEPTRASVLATLDALDGGAS